jgi:hypothetical protein
LALNAPTAAPAAPPVVTPPGTIFLLAMRVTALSIASSSPTSFDSRAFKSPICVEYKNNDDCIYREHFVAAKVGLRCRETV